MMLDKNPYALLKTLFTFSKESLAQTKLFLQAYFSVKMPLCTVPTNPTQQLNQVIFMLTSWINFLQTL